jgi:hypothetical protein
VDLAFQETLGNQEALCPIDLMNMIYPEVAEAGT